MSKRSLKKLVRDWKDTLKENDAIRKRVAPLWNSAGKVFRSISKETDIDGRKDNTSWESQDKGALDLNDGFFVKIASLEWKKQSLRHHSEELEKFSKVNGQKTDEYEGDNKEVKKTIIEQQKDIDKTKQVELYGEVIFVTVNQFVSEQQRKDAPVPGELYVYGQEVFGITQEQHRELFAKVKKREPPVCNVKVTDHTVCAVNGGDNTEDKITSDFSQPISAVQHCGHLIKIVEARNIEAKDANGYSDPYCMIGIVADNSFHRKVKRKGSKTLTVSEQLEEELIKVTTVKKKTLNPVWNETFTLNVNDALSESLHLDMWDQDEDTAFLDKDNSLMQIRGVAGVGRFFKQVVQSSRKCSTGASMDDFLGFIEFPVKDIPSNGLDKWFPLQARSAKSTTDGDCHLIIKLVGKNNNNANEQITVSKCETFSSLLKAFLVFDGEHPEELDDVDRSGQLSGFAQWILHQYIIQNNILSLQRAILEWQVFSNYHQTQPLKYSFLKELLFNIVEHWRNGKLSDIEEGTFHDSLQSFVGYCFQLLKDHRELYPATESSKLSRLSHMLNCLKMINDLPSYSANQGSSIIDEITGTIKMATERWYSVQYEWHQPTEPTQTSTILAFVTFSELIVVDLYKALKFYSKIFKEIGVDYFAITYKALEKLLASDMRTSISKMDPTTLHYEVGDNDLGTKLFSLYLATKEIMEYRQYLPISEATEFAFDSSHLWFKKFIDHWFDVAHQKSVASINKAVEIDQAVVIDSTVKYSTSAVDVTCCFYQVCEFWKRLRWPDPAGSYVFVTRITDDICDAARFYGDALMKKLKDNDFYDDNPSYFGVSESLCITLNNLAYTQQWLSELEIHLDWDEVVSGMKSSFNEREAKKCEETLKQFSEHTREILFSKIDEMIYHIGEKMAVDIKKFVTELVNEDESVDMTDSMDPLLHYLEKSLRTFFSCLLRTVFDRTLLHLWTLVVDNIISTVGGDKGKPIFFYNRLNKVLEILIDFFCVDGVGIPLQTMMDKKVNSLIDDLLTCQLSTEELIEEYYIEKIVQKADSELDLGHLCLRMFYDLINQNLHVELLNGRNLPPLDSNGFCDPYVKLAVCPRHLFPNTPVERTDIHKKTLFPLFDAKFIFKVPATACRKPGAHLQLSVFDYDVITDDVAGQVFVPLNNIPGLDEEIPATFAGIEQTILPIIHPTPDGRYFEILKARNDAVALKFVKDKQDLHYKLLGTREAILKRTQSPVK